MSDRSDVDIPGDEHFTPAPEVIGISGMWVNVIPKSIDEQRAIYHNQLRYAELQKLRRGQPNQYQESRYR